MNQKQSLYYASAVCLQGAFGLAVLALPAFAAGKTPVPVSTPAQANAPRTVEGFLYSTMPSEEAHRPEMTVDADPQTYFRSAYGMDDGDEFLLRLSQPIPLRALQITTGDAQGQDLLTEGFVETSPDSIHFSKAAVFNPQGIAQVSLAGKPVQALRIRLNPGQGIPALLVREITLTSPVPISHIALGPGRGLVDVSQAPDVAGWAKKAETQMEESWPDTAALLYTDHFLPPNLVHVVYRTGDGVPGVAATGGGVMTVNAQWCRQHPEDTGLTVHETAHVIQAYNSYNPIWLVEGIADYIRWVKFEPEHFHPRLNPQTATYHDAYQTTATFLGWCELHYDSGLVTKLSRAVRFGTYTNDLFTQYCGKNVDALWTEFVAAYRADPANIITTPRAAADRPRLLPVVNAGTSVPVNLSAAFNTMGMTPDDAVFPATGGMDGEGAAYSASLLGPVQTTQGVSFTLGPAQAANAVTCGGSVLPLPGGRYSSLWLLGTAVEGAQRAQTFLVTYTDGTHEELSQNLSDWFQPQDFPGESRALRMAYRNQSTGAKDGRPFYVYSYGFPLPGTKIVQSLTLPRNASVKLLAVSLVPALP